MSDTTTRLLTVSQWNEHHEWPPEGGMRHLIFNADTNGFASAFKRVGRRVLIDEVEFFRCVERQNAAAGKTDSPVVPARPLRKAARRRREQG